MIDYQCFVSKTSNVLLNIYIYVCNVSVICVHFVSSFMFALCLPFTNPDLYRSVTEHACNVKETITVSKTCTRSGYTGVSMSASTFL